MRLRSGGAYAAELPQAALLPHDVLVRICSLLPRGVLAVTPGRVCRTWATAKKEAWAAALAAAAAREAWTPDFGSGLRKSRPYLPLWYVRGVVGHASDYAKWSMMLGACFHGLIDVVEELCAAAPRDFFGIYPCEAAAAGGRLDVLVFLRERGFPSCKLACKAAAEGGYLDVVIYLCKQDGPFSSTYLNEEASCAAAARHGHLHILEGLHAQGACSVTVPVLCQAVSGGHFEIVTWLRQRGCAWHEDAIRAAACNGDLPMLQFLRAQGCEWGQGACLGATAYGRLEVLQYLVEHGCPIDVKECIEAAYRQPAFREFRKTLQLAAAR
jgi:hypothetical protein